VHHDWCGLVADLPLESRFVTSNGGRRNAPYCGLHSDSADVSTTNRSPLRHACEGRLCCCLHCVRVLCDDGMVRYGRNGYCLATDSRYCRPWRNLWAARTHGRSVCCSSANCSNPAVSISIGGTWWLCRRPHFHARDDCSSALYVYEFARAICICFRTRHAS
jgi:hypothetical protein